MSEATLTCPGCDVTAPEARMWTFPHALGCDKAKPGSILYYNPPRGTMTAKPCPTPVVGPLEWDWPHWLSEDERKYAVARYLQSQVRFTVAGWTGTQWFCSVPRSVRQLAYRVFA